MRAAPAALITALDVDSRDAALALAGQTIPASPWVKVGLELFAAASPAVVSTLADRGARVFLDLKFFDIPATVRAAVRQAGRLGAAMTTLHALGGERMAAAALEGRHAANADTLLVAVTLLTSMTGEDLAWLAPDAPGHEAELVVHMARQAQAWGLDGVVCSPREAALVKAACGPAFKVVTPGIRPQTTDDDQRRTATPAAAVAAGADFLVVGRPIRTATSPAAAAAALAREILLASSED
ncbi:orotidine-5'-phosphate decarboxylase [Megalodesulfovibrio gigas]|uniref:orotidine-5'-phosphate decarboxylase n=1 Tax=Megalodesulfovibrio gigas TaxID=879 RepID=UPI000483F495|nr:orotidine-5'-phosphate decarboxylase [Megalodesulfovibrio gigas]